MSKLDNAQRAAMARLLADSRAELRYGLVTSYDADTYACVVNIMPEQVPTGWLPLASDWVGAGFGLYFGPTIGDQVLVAHVEGDRNVGIILKRLNSDSDKPPSVPSGECWMLHQSGSYLKFTNDGNVSIHGTVLIQIGNLANAIHKLVIDTFVNLFNTHTHKGVTAGAGNSGVTNQLMDSSHQTTIVKAN